MIDLMPLPFQVAIVNISYAYQQMRVPAALIPCLLSRCMLDLERRNKQSLILGLM